MGNVVNIMAFVFKSNKNRIARSKMNREIEYLTLVNQKAENM